MIHLSFITGSLLIAVSTDSAVRCDPELWLFILRTFGASHLTPCRNHGNCSHYANHYATIKKWLDEDSKGMSAKNYTYDDNEGECL